MILNVLKSKLIEFQKARDLLRVGVLRFLISDINNKEIAMRANKQELADKHIIKVIDKQIKQRKDSIEAYKSGNRDDLAQKELAELGILEEILELVAPDEE